MIVFRQWPIFDANVDVVGDLKSSHVSRISSETSVISFGFISSKWTRKYFSPSVTPDRKCRDGDVFTVVWPFKMAGEDALKAKIDQSQQRTHWFQLLLTKIVVCISVQKRNTYFNYLCSNHDNLIKPSTWQHYFPLILGQYKEENVSMRLMRFIHFKFVFVHKCTIRACMCVNYRFCFLKFLDFDLYSSWDQSRWDKNYYWTQFWKSRQLSYCSLYIHL